MAAFAKAGDESESQGDCQWWSRKVVFARSKTTVMNRGNALMRRLRLTIYVSIATPRPRSFLSVKNHFLTNPSFDGSRTEPRFAKSWRRE
jgi:hypothetical protein